MTDYVCPRCGAPGKEARSTIPGLTGMYCSAFPRSCGYTGEAVRLKPVMPERDADAGTGRVLAILDRRIHEIEQDQDDMARGGNEAGERIAWAKLMALRGVRLEVENLTVTPTTDPGGE